MAEREDRPSSRHRPQVEKTIRAEDQWEPVGPTPMPDIADLRNWDMRLLKTYAPSYAPICDLCCLCTFGKCDLTGDKRGACGIDIATQQARLILLACLIGTSAHTAHARHILEYLIDQHGENYKIDLGDKVDIEAPHIRTVLGMKPQTLGDLVKVLDYVNNQVVQMLDATHTGQEGSHLDYESKALHAAMLDHVGMEAADIAQITGFKFPTSRADVSLVDMGWGAVDVSKPTIAVIGHNPVSSIKIIDYLRRNNLYDKVEVAGVCCTAIETTRYSDRATVIGPLSRQLYFVRTGIADVIVTDEQCIRTDLPLEARKAGSAFIASSDKACHGLEEVSDRDTDEIVRDIVAEGKQVLILDHEKVGEVAVKAALALAPQRKKELATLEEAQAHSRKCVDCDLCERVCPNMLLIGEAMRQLARGNPDPMTDLFAQCIGCGKCQAECPHQVPIFRIMQAVASRGTYRMRQGRGPIMDTEIRKVGAPLVLGTIPGVVAFVGCSNFPDINDVVEMVEEFAKRKYIVVLSGCTAMVAGMKKDSNGQTVYEKYPPDFDAGGVINVGSCVANSHITGAAIKIASIFAGLPLRANYEVIADYVLNRVGAVGVAWGAYSQKAAAIATGCNRLGIPVVLGPHASKYRRLYLSRKGEDDWTVMDGRKREMVDTHEPSPEHLAYVTETKEKAMVMIAKLCMRRNDTAQGRALKLNHYISLYKKYMGGGLPDDLHLFVRTDKDLPIVYKKEAVIHLKEAGWQPKPVLTLPTLI
ncbi:MAG: CO dehydrogenase/acetyl-CoA synthase complex subunit alpha, partial [Chloroflexi bacterium]|nr:CO dehydrogenase/acetyl-CoA synthase complex subunit alpha [Chloroflexota bacterium]